MKINGYDPPCELDCIKCPAYERCLSEILEDTELEIKCIYYGLLKTQVMETVDKLNSIGSVCQLSPAEVKSVILFSSTK